MSKYVYLAFVFFDFEPIANWYVRFFRFISNSNNVTTLSEYIYIQNERTKHFEQIKVLLWDYFDSSKVNQLNSRAIWLATVLQQVRHMCSPVGERIRRYLSVRC